MYTNITKEHQKLVDLIFSIGLTTKQNNDHFSKLDNDQYAEWVREKLKSCGVETIPKG